jgi:uncharacterized protein (TIGR02172 family)
VAPDLNADLGRPIAYGRTAEIYAWQQGQILKLFHGWFALDDIRHEAQMAQAIHARGLPVPAVGELVRVDGRYGLVYERVEGPTMWQMFSLRPWRTPHYARRTAELHAEMHARSTNDDIPDQRRKLAGKIRRARPLPAPVGAKALAALESMPLGDRLCHGDFHPGNILMTAQGEVIIDWIDAASGNPLADVARTTVLALGAAETDQIQGRLEKALVRIFHALYRRRYFQLRPGGQAEYRRWVPIVAAARLSENIPEIEAWLIAQAEGLGMGD